MAPAQDRDKALDMALAQIDRQFGKGSVMRLGDDVRAPIEVIPTGSIALDIALGIGGLPRGRVVEIYGPESSGKTSLALHAIASAQAAGGIAAFIDAEHALDPPYAAKLGVDTDALLVSQPDTGEQALEIADMLIRSGALDVLVIDSVAALVPRAEIEGEMGDSHVGLQARLMSQALRKLTGALSVSRTTAIFINQLREKIGVLFGCLAHDTPVTLADGSTLPIGEIVDRRLPVEVLSYDPDAGRMIPRKVVNWFDNGATDRFLQLTVERAGAGAGHDPARLRLTSNHLVRTPGGWREAAELLVGDRVMLAAPHRLSPQQWQVVLGGLMGDAALCEPVSRNGGGARFTMGHGGPQADYLRWKSSLLANIEQSCRTDADGVPFVELTPLAELAELRDVVYFGDGKKHITWDYLKALTPLALAIWYMDAALATVPPTGAPARAAGAAGCAQLCVEAMSPGSRERLVDHLRDTYGLEGRVTVLADGRTTVLRFTADSTARLQNLVAPHVHPSMDYLLPPRLRGQFSVDTEVIDPVVAPVAARIAGIEPWTPRGGSHRFDLEVEGSHSYLADGVVVHNSPETTSGGRALKFYASVRLDVRRIETLKDGQEAVGNRIRVKVVKNKVSPPFRQAEMDLLFGQGISREGGLIDMGVEHGFVRKSGAWYTYEGDQLGQGKENARAFLRDNPDLSDELEKRIKERLGVGPKVDAPIEGAATPVPPVDL